MNVEELNKKIQELQQLAPDATEAAVKDFVKNMPAPESAADAASKVQLLVLRGRAKLLAPSLEKEAESDLSKALKLNAKDKSAWLALSEVQWKRRSFREARDAAESAVRLAPNDIPALCQASRLARVVSMNEKNVEKKPALIATSIQRAKQALAIDSASSDAWLALGLSLFHEACVQAMAHTSLKKALAAVTQACRCDAKNADAFINRGLVEHALCQFGDALVSFESASTLDPLLKSQTEAATKRSMGMLLMLQQRVRVPLADRQKISGIEWKDVVKAINASSLEKPSINGTTAEFSSLANVLANPSGGGAGGGARAIVVCVLRLVSGESDMPLVFEAMDREKTICCLAVSNLHPRAIPNNKYTGVTVMVPPGEVVTIKQLADNVSSAESKVAGHLRKIAGGLLPLNGLFCDAKSILIKGAPVAPELQVEASVSVTSL